METFVVRVWVPGVPPKTECATEALQGVVEHAATKTSTPFHDSTELVAFIAAAIRRQTAP
jgi:hypothetical protein